MDEIIFYKVESSRSKDITSPEAKRETNLTLIAFEHRGSQKSELLLKSSPGVKAKPTTKCTKYR